MSYPFYEKQYDFQPGEYPIWIRRMPGNVRDKIWTPYSVRCAACSKRHNCKCRIMSLRDEIRSRPWQEVL